MKLISKIFLTTLPLLLFFSSFSTALAKEYSFSDSPASKITYKISTSQTSADITIKSLYTAGQHFNVSIWKTADRSDPTNKIIQKEIIFNTQPPRSTSFTITGLTRDTSYYFFNAGEGEPADISQKFLTENASLSTCQNCSFGATISGSNILVTLSGINPATVNDMRVFVLPTPFPLGELCHGSNIPTMCTSFAQPPKEVLANGSIRWSIPISLLHGKTLLYIRAEGLSGNSVYISPTAKVTTPDEVVDSVWPLTYEPHDTEATISGKLNNSDKSDFSVILQYSLSQLSPTGEALPSDAHQVVARKGPDSSDVEGVNDDGTYFFQLKDLSPNRLYFVKQIIKAPSRGALDIKVNNTGFNSTTGYKPEGSQAQLDDIAKRSYKLLAPFSEKLQVVLDPDLCREFVAQGKIPAQNCDNQISDLLNLMLTIIIGIAAVVLVVQLILQGYTYMITDTPFKKLGAKTRFVEALFGLLLAMSAYLILNTINPKLVSNTIGIDQINLAVKEFVVSGGSTGSFDGKEIRVNFNKEAYPAALNAYKKTGVDTAFILAIFAQETGSGANVGKCRWTDYAANMYPEDKTAFQTITSELSRDPNQTAISCALKNSDGSFNGHGGAIGYTQVLPTTWLANRLEAKGYLGHMPNPWNTEDAIMVTAVYLKKNGALSNERESACKYFAGPGSSCSKNSGVASYGDSVMGKKISIQKQIESAKAKGEIQ